MSARFQRHREDFRRRGLANYYRHKADRDRKARDSQRQIRLEVLTYYGNGKLACVQCGEARSGCLSIDHINNGGRRERILWKLHTYNKLKSAGFPMGYQTLCMNCQFIKLHDYRESNPEAFRKNTTKISTNLVKEGE
jgi:hypothetical protein